jgi:Ras-related protein Rab-6A
MAQTHKVVIIGDTTVGKTSIIKQFVFGTAANQHQPTVGIDFFAKVVDNGDAQVRLHVWDTAGQEQFRSLIPAYLRNSTVTILVFDITNRATFESLANWHKMTLELTTPAFVVVGNKVDLAASRTVATEDGEQWAKSISALYFETSAITSVNIQELFQAIAGIPLQKPVEAAPDPAPQPVVQKVQLDEAAKRKGKVCC